MTNVADLLVVKSAVSPPFETQNRTIRVEGANGPRFWDSLTGATIKLAVLFWTGVLVTDSLLWGVSGVDPIGSFTGKLLENSFGALLTLVIAGALYGFRNVGMLTKVVMAFAFSLLATPVYCLFDFALYIWGVWPEMPYLDWHNFGITMVAAFGMFFGWSCLFVSLVYSFEVQDHERRLAMAREEALTAQMRALRFQINPHFLFNTLNSIAGLIEEGSTTRAERMVGSLSTFLRITLTLDPLNDVPLAEELMLQEEYLEIQRERFSDRMDFTIDVAESACKGRVPSLILQPLVENAIKHGLNRSIEAININIHARRNGDRLLIAVENNLNFHPLDGALASQGLGIGLRNVAGRIQARYGESGRFTSGMTNAQRFRAEIDIPWQPA